MKKIKLAIVGIQGLPNNYGGFETLAEYLVKYLSDDFEITVYCSSKDLKTRLKSRNGAKLKYIPVSSHGAKGIIYDSLSFIHACFNSDKILFLGFGGGFVVPFLKMFKSKIILNFGGLDWKRDKWSPMAQRAIKFAEKTLMKNSTIIISDNIGIRNYIKDEYNIDAPLIAYGGNQARYLPITKEFVEKYPFLNEEYAFTVTRIQSDNNIDMILEAFESSTDLPIVMVGNWNSSDYGIQTKIRFQRKKNIILLDAIYDRDVLDVLRSNCTLYIHGHSAGGTNPSLCEAMYLGLSIIAFASGYNEYTTNWEAIYFRNKEELVSIIKNRREFNLQGIGKEMKNIAEERYIWEKIALQYKEIILK
jgi:Glycosyltransferase